jgi:peptidoglycan/LPS O-acetylase OafA/YrhL
MQTPSTRSQTPPAPTRLDYLDGLRALAALYVVLSHVWILQYGLTPLNGTIGLLGNWLIYSHLAVVLFIVLSGYGLMQPVLRDRGLKGGLATFFSRRVTRILPPYYAGVAIGVAVSLLLPLVVGQRSSFNWHALLANLVLIQDIFTFKWNVFNGPLWCVAAQWRLYLLFPIAVWILLEWGRIPLLIATTVIGYFITALVFQYDESAFMSCPWFLSIFAMGMCAASLTVEKPEASKSPVWSAAIIAALIALVYLLKNYPFTSGRHIPLADFAAGAFVAAGLIVLLGAKGTLSLRIKCCLSWPPLTSLGRVSYSLYLIHSPCLILLHFLLLRTHFYANGSLLERAAILLILGGPLVFGLANLFYKYVEMPFASRRKK